MNTSLEQAKSQYQCQWHNGSTGGVADPVVWRARAGRVFVEAKGTTGTLGCSIRRVCSLRTGRWSGQSQTMALQE
jgi:hypothetical protein